MVSDDLLLFVSMVMDDQGDFLMLLGTRILWLIKDAYFYVPPVSRWKISVWLFGYGYLFVALI